MTSLKLTKNSELSQLMEEKQRQHCEEQENIDELKRYREETAEENKVVQFSVLS